jgi:hypothetical protein
MIVALERNKFTYLYKYNTIRVDINQIIDWPSKKILSLINIDTNKIISLLEKAIPLFEQDHEIILLEVSKENIIIDGGILLTFNSITSIYPLTEVGRKLLDGKISDDFIINEPLFEKFIDNLKINRSMSFRRNTSEKLLEYYGLSEILSYDFKILIESSIKNNLIEKRQNQALTSYLDYLIAYNKTPSYIPDGNIEHICKIGAITMKFLGKPDEVFTNGPFYNSTVKYKSKINSNSVSDSYLKFFAIQDEDLLMSRRKIVDYISKDFKNADVFKISYYFLAFKAIINKNDNNIDCIKSEIAILLSEDKNTTAFVLSLLGYTYSFENIYEGLHRLSNAPLLKSSISKQSDEKEKEIEPILKIQISTSNPSDDKIQKLKETGVLEFEWNIKDNPNSNDIELNKNDMPETVQNINETDPINSDQNETAKNDLVDIEQDKVESPNENAENDNSEDDENRESLSDKIIKTEIEQNNNEIEPITSVQNETAINDLADIEQDNAKSNDDNIEKNKTTDNEDTEVVSVKNVIPEINQDKNDITNPEEYEDESIKSNENKIVTEPQTVYENNKDILIDESIKTDYTSDKNDNDINKLASSKENQNKSLTSQIFKNNYVKEQGEKKSKAWLEFFEQYFPNEEEIISAEMILVKIDESSEAKYKIIRGTKERKSVIEFCSIFK